MPAAKTQLGPLEHPPWTNFPVLQWLGLENANPVVWERWTLENIGELWKAMKRAWEQYKFNWNFRTTSKEAALRCASPPYFPDNKAFSFTWSHFLEGEAAHCFFLWSGHLIFIWSSWILPVNNPRGCRGRSAKWGEARVRQADEPP